MANFETAVAITLDHEKGYQANPKDKGNYNSLGQLVGTNFGISAPTYERYLGHPPTVNEMKGITRSIATAIYRAHYWNPFILSLVNSQAIANQLFDIAVLQGAGSMAKIIQKALNTIGIKVAVDGAFGVETRAGINQAVTSGKEIQLNNATAAQRESLLHSADWPGWIPRAQSYILDLASGLKKKTRFF